MSSAPEPTTPTPNEHQTTRERVLAIAGWLVEGRLRPECVALAMKEWQVSRRSAQVYVARAAARIVKATTFEDPLFALKLSQVQRDRLHQQLQELLRSGEFLPLPHWQMKVKTIQADLKLLDSRDRTAVRIVQMEGGQVRRPPPTPPCKGGEKDGSKGGEKGEMKVLRPEPASAPPGKTEPRAPSGPAPELDKRLRTVSLDDKAQPAAHISIVPTQRKAKGGKEMCPAQRPAATPAPGADSCALETKMVVKAARSEEASAGNRGDYPT